MKLLIVTTIPRTIKAFLLPYAQHFRQLGWTVDAACSPGQGVSEIRPAFHRLHEIRWSRQPWSPFNLIAVSELTRVLRSSHYDIVHTHTPVASFVTRLAAQRLATEMRPVVVYTAHGFHFHPCGGILTNWAYRFLERLVAPATDCLIVINETDRKAALTELLIEEEKLVHMPGIGIDLTSYNRARVSSELVATLRQELNLEPECQLIVMIGELSRRKRPQDAIRAFALLNRPQTALLVAGDGPLRGTCQRLARKLGVVRNVRFLGVRSDIPVLLAAARMCVLASAHEGLPRCLMEAMALGTPIVASACRGTRDLVQNDSGLLVPTGDVSALASAMARTLDDPVGAARRAQNAFNEVRAASLDRLLAMHEQLYSHVYERSRSLPFRK